MPPQKHWQNWRANHAAPHALPFDCCGADDWARARGAVRWILKRHKLLELWGIDHAGTDELDRRYLTTLAETYRGGPAGVEALAATIEDARTLEDLVEPFLLQEGLVARTRSGRRLTDAGHHIGWTPPDAQSCSEKTTDEHQRTSSEDRGGHHRPHWRDSHAPRPEPRHRPLHFVAQIGVPNRATPSKINCVSMINRAEEEGRSSRVEPSMKAPQEHRIALALVGVSRGYKVKVVMPDKMSRENLPSQALARSGSDPFRRGPRPPAVLPGLGPCSRPRRPQRFLHQSV